MVIESPKESNSRVLVAAWDPNPEHCKIARESPLTCCQECSWCQTRILALTFLKAFHLLSSGFQTIILRWTFHIPQFTCLVLKWSVTKTEQWGLCSNSERKQNYRLDAKCRHFCHRRFANDQHLHEQGAHEKEKEKKRLTARLLES